MTAHALAGEREKCLSYGMNEYISKPIREEQLYRLISQFTQIKYSPALKKETSLKNTAGAYQFIDLQYMKEVSGGNTEYEKTVTEQFIEAIPEDLSELEKAWNLNDINQLRQLAHNMKTTVSVMGLNEVLQPYLDTIEYENLNEESFRIKFLSVKSICEASLEEANIFILRFNFFRIYTMKFKITFGHLLLILSHSRVFIFIIIGTAIIFLTFVTNDNALEIAISGMASMFIGIGVNNFSSIER